MQIIAVVVAALAFASSASASVASPEYLARRSGSGTKGEISGQSNGGSTVRPRKSPHRNPLG